MLGSSSGLAFYNQSVLLEALTRERGFPVAQASLATTIFFASSGLSGLLVAYLLERIDPRWTILGGLSLSVTALVLIGRVDSLGQLYAVFALFGCGFSGASLVPGTTLITRWFVTKRSLALAIMTTGLSVGGIALTPLAARILETRGLREGTPWIAALMALCVAPLTLALVRRSPAVLGLLPDGAQWRLDPSAAGDGQTRPSAQPPPGPGQALLDGVAFRDALRTRFFLGLSIAFLFGLAAQVGGLAHQFNLATTVAGPATARQAVSLLAAGSIVGRLVASLVVRKVPIRQFTIGLLLCQGVMLLFLGRADTAQEVLLTSAAFGLTVGSTLLMQPLLVAEAFGISSYARLYSITSLVAALGIALGPTLLGVVYDLSGGYRIAFLAMLACSILGALALALAGPVEAPRTEFAAKRRADALVGVARPTDAASG
jgi:sugar phosphate permease